jgi:hypothetical protein
VITLESPRDQHFQAKCLAEVPVTIEASIEAAVKPMKLCKRIHDTCRELGSRFAIQSLGLDEPGTSCGIPK